jgi:RNA polymerase sigma-70 factor (ECF subfamily)
MLGRPLKSKKPHPKGKPSAFAEDLRVYEMKEFEELYRKHLDAVFRYTLHCVGRRAIAEEITSEAFLALFRNLDHIDKSQLPGWLLTVARNRAMDYWRRQAVERRYAESLPDPAAAAAPPSSSAGGLFDSKVLKPLHRVCLILRYAHGMDRSEIAQWTGLSQDQVKSCLQYARRLLRNELLACSRRGLK